MTDRIFKVTTKSLGEPRYFSNKRGARVFRDERIEAGESCVIMRGPDHWRGESFNTSEKTRSSKRGRR
jgi:hypothetical protein